MRGRKGDDEETRWRTIRGNEKDMRRAKGNRNMTSLYAVQ